MKLVFTDYNCLTEDIVTGEWLILNLNSFMEGFERLNILPPFGLEYGDKNFDIMYANYILQNDIPFMELMKIIMTIYSGNNVIILSSKGNIYEFVAESLQKFIQQRYSLVSYIVNDLDDWQYVEDTMFDINGVYNLDLDKERFTYLYAQMNLHQFRSELENGV